MRVLVVNVGSSGLKLRLLDDGDDVIAGADLADPVDVGDGELIRSAIEGWSEIDAVGHRIVHGGTVFHGPVQVDADVRARLAALAELAPLHQGRALAALDAVSTALPGLPAVACFDTAFHATLPPAAATYALPEEWRNRLQLRRFGFHGLSHAYVARRTGELVQRDPTALRIVSCHLGAGASLAAIDRGRSVDTTMGFTPLDGLVMATRSGSVDPGMLLWLQGHEGMTPASMARDLEHRSGLLGLTGTADMREVIDRSREGDVRATIGLEVYVHRLRGGIASMAAAMGGLEVLVFTGGAGERSATLRAMAASGLGFLGVEIDEAANRDAVGDFEISPSGAEVRTLVVAAREDLQIAREVRQLLDGTGR